MTMTAITKQGAIAADGRLIDPAPDHELAAAVLGEAAALVRGGWTQGAFARIRDGRTCDYADGCAAEFCLDGARRRAMAAAGAGWHDGGEGWRVFAITEEALERAILRETGERPGRIADYNDAPERTQAEAAAVAERAAAECRELRPYYTSRETGGRAVFGG